MFRAAGYQTRLRLVQTCAMAMAISSAFTSLPADSGISLNQTRVVFSATEKAHTVTVKNTGTQTYLIQSRVQQTPGNQAAAPFLVTPPLVVIQPDSHQLLRIVPHNVALPTDRESVFYLSLMAIPARKEKENAPRQLSIGLRFLIKLFYRPVAVPPPDPAAPCSLRFQRAAQGVLIDNPTPRFQTLGRLAFDHIPHTLDMADAMIAPLSTRAYPVAQTAALAEWQVITDYGALSTPVCQQTLNPHQEGP